MHASDQTRGSNQLGLDLGLPEPPPPTPKPHARSGGSRRSAATGAVGSGKGGAPVPPSPAPAQTLAQPVGPVERVAEPTAPALTPEAMAQVLAAHPDYRVLRRLVPTLDFGGLQASSPQEAEASGAEASAAGDTGGSGFTAHPVALTAPELRTLLVLDTETTGLDASRDRIIELALLRVQVNARTGLPVGPVTVYDGLEDPGMSLPPAIVDITGITDDMLRGQRLDDARVAALMQGVDLVVAHNAGFDRPFVEGRYPAFAQLPWACSWADVDWKALGQGSTKLEGLAQTCGWFYDAHRAETDCHALLAVLAQPVTRFGAGGGVPAETLPADALPAARDPVLARLLVSAATTHYRLQATGAPFDAKDALKARGYRWDAQQRVWGTTLRSEAALTQELAWLGQHVYHGRGHRVRVEALDALTRYAARAGQPSMVEVPPAGAAASVGLGGEHGTDRLL